MDGEFDRVDVGLEEPEGLLSFRTDTGNLELVDNGPRSMWGFVGREACDDCDRTGPGLVPAISLCDRLWTLVDFRFFVSVSS